MNEKIENITAILEAFEECRLSVVILKKTESAQSY